MVIVVFDVLLLYLPPFGSIVNVYYLLSGWDFSGSGTWNPNNQKYTFGTGDGNLTAKWVEKTIDTDPENPNNINKKYTLTEIVTLFVEPS